MACVGFETIKGFLHSQEMIAVNRVQRSLKVSLEIQKLLVSVLIVIGEATAVLESDTIQGKTGQQLHWHRITDTSSLRKWLHFIHSLFFPI